MSNKFLPVQNPTPTPLIHRDLSWIQFNSRVLNEASSKTNPLLERAKFLGISASNLDEFFSIRFSSLNRTILTLFRKGHKPKAKRLMHIRDLIEKEVNVFKTRKSEIFEALRTELKSHGICIVGRKGEDPAHLELGKQIFQSQILPHLKECPDFRSKDISQLGNFQMVALSLTGKGWIIPRELPPLYYSNTVVFFLDHLLNQHLGQVIRITRDGDFTFNWEEEDSESIPDMVKTGIKNRDKGRIVRIQYTQGLPKRMLSELSTILKLRPSQIFEAPETLCLHGLSSLTSPLPEDFKTNPALCYPPVKTTIPRVFKNYPKIIETLKVRDLLLHHPYDSFDAFCLWVREACNDPMVTMIELTVYRMDAISEVIGSLKKAAQSKKIKVMIELRARFDELNNIRLAEELGSAGCEVKFGFGRLKLHAKIALVTRKEESGVKLYTHLSTGNYNAVTARQYTDLSILTAHPEIGTDARTFFDGVFCKQIPTHFKHLISAPTGLQRRILQLIDLETKAALQKKKARIVAKVNSLVDESVVQRLYKASQAGVSIDLIVRGACSLVPGIKGLSETIRVVSIVDRFLEHSRIYFFENSRTLYLSSADWMPRNFFSRLELAFPILDPKIFEFIEKTLIPAYLSDNMKSNELLSNQNWKPRVPKPEEPKMRSQFYLEELSFNKYKGTALA